MYGLCEIVVDLTDADAAKHPNPYLTVQLSGEFRSPRHKTYRMPGFWDGGKRFIIRFSPDEAGQWTYRLNANFGGIQDKVDTFTATQSDHPGFIRPANVHHWRYTGSMLAHLWMGDTQYRFGFYDRPLFDKMLEARAAQKFNHIRGYTIGAGADDLKKTYPTPDTPNAEFFRELDSRIRAINARGIIVDLILGGDKNELATFFPAWAQRERYLTYMVARYAAMNVTWQLSQEFEEYRNGKTFMREMGLLLKRIDPCNHPRTVHTTSTSSPLLADGWMDHIIYQSSDDHLGAIEHQLYPVPFVNTEFAYENSGAGATHPHHVEPNEFRRRLWNSAMNGQYPTYANTGIYGSATLPNDAKWLDAPGAKAMTAWFDFFSKTRHWELEPYFDVDGGRALALPGVEYIVYIEKPSGPIEVTTEKHDYDVYWINPATGEAIKEKKSYKGEAFTGTPPDNSHDWVLHLSRDGRKEGMLRSYKFESRPNLMQEVELSSTKIPFDLAAPAQGDLPVGKPVPFEIKLKRETRATRRMMYILTAEVSRDGQAARVVGSGAKGTFTVPASLANTFPAVMTLRVTGMNAIGKVYSTDYVFTLSKE